ncbi:unnamed protein product [Phytomonas sp. Hart1]|nr:unnamed protein product [Phytomonas sp. Hart1]|eukprot:CCW67998.1 unnamed protein product [Phytomonas sp. isolate Hart1]
MSNNIPAAAQADLMEKEKLIVEHQQRVESLQNAVKTMATRQVSLKRDKRRAEITIGELSKLKTGHPVYRGIGRAFMRIPADKLIAINDETIKQSDAEDQRISNEKQRTSEAMSKEEGELHRAIEDYRLAVHLIQVASGQQQQRR